MSDFVQYYQLRQEAKLLDDEIKQLAQAQPGKALQLHQEAATLYQQLFQLRPDSYNANRYIHHMRKRGVNEAREASKFARKVADQYKDFLSDTYFVSEYVWSIYDGYLKNSRRQNDSFVEDNENEETSVQVSSKDLSVKVEAARRIFALTTEAFPRIRTAFVICKEAKLHKRWDIVQEFGHKLQPETISTKREKINGRLGLSDYQQWLYAVTRAALELQQYDECRAYAHMGIEKYPDESLHFQRWEALAKIRTGDVQGGLDQLKYIDAHFPKQWYIQGDIAQVYMQLKQQQEAWLWFCRAVSAPGDVKGRITLLKAMCELLQSQEEWQATYHHLLLVWAIETAFGSKENYIERTRQKILALKKAHADVLSPLPDDKGTKAPPLGKVLKLCRIIWQETLQTATPTKTGKIVQLNEQQQFGFIEDEQGNRYHFKFSAFVRGQPEMHMQIKFALVESFDKKKDRMSVTATNIRPQKNAQDSISN